MADPISELFVSLKFKVDGVADLQAAARALKSLNRIAPGVTKPIGRAVAALKQLSSAAKEATGAINGIPQIRIAPVQVAPAAAAPEVSAQAPEAKPAKPTKVPKAFFDTPTAAAQWKALNLGPKAGVKGEQLQAFREARARWEARLKELTSKEGALSGREALEAVALERRLKRFKLPKPAQPPPLPSAESHRAPTRAWLATNNWVKAIHALRHEVNVPGTGLLSTLGSLATRIHPVVAGVTAIAMGTAYAAKQAATLGLELSNLRLGLDIDTASFQEAAYTAKKLGVGAEELAGVLARIQEAQRGAKFRGEGLKGEYGFFEIGPNTSELQALENIRRKIHEADASGNRAQIQATREFASQLGLSQKMYVMLRRAKADLTAKGQAPWTMDRDSEERWLRVADAWREAGAEWNTLFAAIGNWLSPVLEILGKAVKPKNLLTPGGPVGTLFSAAGEYFGERMPQKKAISVPMLTGMLAMNPALGLATAAHMRPPEATKAVTVTNNVKPTVNVTAPNGADPYRTAEIINGVLVDSYDNAFRQSNLAASGDATNRP